MTRRSTTRLLLAILAALALALVSCGGGSSSDGANADKGDAADTADDAADDGAADDPCPAETTYEITGPDGAQSFTAASAYARESSDYLNIFLFSKDFAEDEVESISTGFITDDPGTLFVAVHPRSGTGSPVTELPTGAYVADTAETQQALEAGNWIVDLTASLGLEQVAVGFPVDPDTTVQIDLIDDERVCGTITHKDATATFNAVHLKAS